MSASTLHSFLIALGFDISGLASGGSAARSELRNLAAAAADMAAKAAPASATIRSVGAAAQQTAGQLSPLITSLNAANASTGILLTTQGAAAMRMREASAAAGPLVTAQQALANANREATTAAGGLVTAEQAAARSMRESYSAAGPLIASLAQVERMATNSAAAGQRYGIAMRGVRSDSDMAQAAILRAAAAFKVLDVAGTNAANSVRTAAGKTADIATFRSGFAAAQAGASARQAATDAELAARGFTIFGTAAERTARQLGGVPGAAGQASKSITMLATAADHVSNRAAFMNRVLSMAFAFSGGVAVTTLFGFLANAVLGFNSRLEQARIAFTTLLEGNTARADAFIKKMQAFANVTPFNFQGVQDAAQRLMAMGFTAEQVLPTLTAVGDAVAALGGNTEKLDRITIALGQMATAGRVNAQDMRQLTEAGIPAWSMLAAGIGKTVAETRKLAENGLIPANQALNILVNTMETKYAGMMAKQARTAQGAFSTIRDMALITISGAVEPLFKALSTGMVGIADFLLAGGGKFIAPAIQAIGIALAVALIPRLYAAAIAASAATMALGALTVPILPMMIAVTALGIAWQENFGGIRDTLGPIVGMLADVALAMLNFAASTGLVGPAILAVVAIITGKFIAGMILSIVTMGAHTLGSIAMAVALRGTGVAGFAALPGLAAAAGGMYGLAAATTLALGPLALLIAALGFAMAEAHRLGELRKSRKEDFGLSEKQAVALQMQETNDPRANLPQVQAAIASIPKATMDAMNATKGIIAKADPMAQFTDLFAAGKDQFLNQTEDLVKTFGTSIDGVRLAGREAGSKAMMEMAEAIAEASSAPADAFKAAIEMTAKALEPTAQIARDVGILMSAELAAGLASQNPEVAAAWQAVRQAAIENLDRLTEGAFSAGAMAGKGWTDAFREQLKSTGMTDFEVIAEVKGLSVEQTRQMSGAYRELGEVWSTKFAPSAAQARAAYDQLKASMASGGGSENDMAAKLVQNFGSSVEAIKEIGKKAGAAMMAEIAQGIAQNSDAPLNAMKDLLDMQKVALARGQEEARLIGMLISQDLANGMKSGEPKVVAQAIATTKFIMDQLNRATPGAYAVGAVLVQAFAAGMLSPQAFAALNRAAAVGRYAAAIMAMTASGDFKGFAQAQTELRNAMNLTVPSFKASADAFNSWKNTLSTGGTSAAKSFSTAMADAKDKIKEAFGEIKRAARSMFDEMHEKNLRAIEDARDLANEALQGKVDQARTALAAKRNNERLFQMQQAVNQAKTAEERANAMIELADFQAELQIEAQQRVVDEQKKINDAKAAEEKKAENARYTEQVAAFNRELAALQRHMLRHPEEWKSMQARVLSLLAEHGVTYVAAGALLGKKFADGLKESVKEAVAAARALAGAAAAAFNAKFKADTKLPSGVPTPPPVPKGTPVPQSGSGGPMKTYGTGLWKSLEDHVAYIHKDEMVVPGDLAGMLRVIARGPIGGGLRPSAFGATAATSGVSSASSGSASRLGSSSAASTGGTGGGTIIFQVGSERLAELMDRGLSVQHDVYAQPVIHNGSGR